MNLKTSASVMLLCLLLLDFIIFSTSSSTSKLFIMPSSNTSCHTMPCYSLSQVMESPSQYFTSNTTAVFPPGYHKVSTEGQLVIQNVSNIFLVGDSHNTTVIQCMKQFGLAFINITNLTISEIYFSMCGVPISYTAQQASGLLAISFHIYKYPHIALFDYLKSSSMTLYLAHITNCYIHKLHIDGSKGMGLLGVNIFGVSFLHQSQFISNSPNCVIIFTECYTPISSSIQYITDSVFMLGASDSNFAAGLSILAEQSLYHVVINVQNVTTYGNRGRLRGTCNMLFSISCNCGPVSIQVKGVNSTGIVGSCAGLALKLKPWATSVCMISSDTYVLHIIGSYFTKNGGISLSTACTVKLENVTIENCTTAPLTAHLVHRKALLVLEDTNFKHNKDGAEISARYSKIELYGSNTFTDNLCTHSLGSALVLKHCSVIFYGNTTFLRNKGRYGAAIYSERSVLNFQRNTIFLENEAESGGALLLYKNVSMTVGQFAEIRFVRNYAQRLGGAVYARDSQIIMKNGGNLSFVENVAYDGGALAMADGSAISFEVQSQTTFVKNHAQHYGGAIYYEDDYKTDVPHFKRDIDRLHGCAYRLAISAVSRNNFSTNLDYTLAHIATEFFNNTAGSAGTAIYGGWVDLCKFHIYYSKELFSSQSVYHNVKKTSVFDNLFRFHLHTQQLSLISSNPTRVCVCTNTSLPDCSITEHTITAYPGETFTIPAVAVGQRFGTVPSTVQSNLVSNDHHGSIPTLQRTQIVNTNCTDISYTIFSSPNRTEFLALGVEKINIPQKEWADGSLTMSFQIGPEETIAYLNVNRSNLMLHFTEFILRIELQLCPLGFIFNNSSKICGCHPKLQQHGINCSIDTQTVYRRSPIWISATIINESYTHIFVHNHCPFDYCKHWSIDLNMEHPNEQCAFHRSGFLCGSCQQNLSQVLGTSNCKKCSNLQLIWLVPLFTAAGIVLVNFLMLLNLTVSVGSINGLIFYANVVRANQAIFFPSSASNSFLGIFIAWLNLDLGFETCFYNGLDAYTKTWLQFLFPLYIWTVVVLIIVSSHYYTIAAKLTGRNAVPVLATLFLMSYAKLLRITITAFSFTVLEYPDSSFKRIWLYDGNVEYLKGRHIALFLATLLLLLTVSLPYTVVLLFIQCLQYRSQYRILLWVWRLKPLFDAYTGPYKDKHRYWPGLLLVVRAVIFLVFSLNVFGDPAVNLLTIAVTSFCIMFCAVLNLGGIYKNRMLNNIEYSFFLNLGVLSSATLYTELTDGNQTAVVYASVSIACATFMGIVLYHILVRVTPEQQQHKFLMWVISKLKTLTLCAKNLCKMKRNQENINNSLLPPSITVSSELREPLLESFN